MTANATLLASPGGGQEGERRPQVSGLGRLTTMKVLKHADVDTPDTLASLMRISARGAAQIHHQTPVWLHVAPMSAAALTAVGMLVTFYVAITRGQKHAGALYIQPSRTSATASVESEKVGADHAIHRIA